MREKILELLKQRPFRPFRIYLSNGVVHMVRHPEQALVTSAYVIVGIPVNESPGPERQRHGVCSLDQCGAGRTIDFAGTTINQLSKPLAQEVATMREEDLLKLLQEKPFRPLRIVLTDGSSHEIRHPEFAWVTRSTVLVGLPASALPVPAIDDYVTIALLHIVKAEFLSSATSSQPASN